LRTSLASLLFVSLALLTAASSVLAETRTASGTILDVEKAGTAMTFVTDTGETVLAESAGRATEIYRSDQKIDLKELKPGEKIWVMWKPGKRNTIAILKTDPDIARETQLLKEKLARAIRILNMEGLVAFSGHISGRIPGGQTFFIHPMDMPRGEVKPSDLCEVTLEAKQISVTNRVPDETDIHAAVYRARKDVSCVLHVHSHYTIVPSLVGKDLIPVSGHGAIFGAKVPVFPHAEKIANPQLADQMAKVFGNGRAVVLKGHGAVIAEGTVESVVTAVLYLEENAKLLVDAMSVGTPIPMTPEELKAAADETYQPTSIFKTWDYYMQKGKKNHIFWD
jgi:L-ribulose-5-phosphate 4-epimerase